MPFGLQMKKLQMPIFFPPSFSLSKSIEQTGMIFDGLWAPIIRTILWLG